MSTTENHLPPPDPGTVIRLTRHSRSLGISTRHEVFDSGQLATVIDRHPDPRIAVGSPTFQHCYFITCPDEEVNPAHSLNIDPSSTTAAHGFHESGRPIWYGTNKAYEIVWTPDSFTAPAPEERVLL
jgi:hypothetical protein